MYLTHFESLEVNSIAKYHRKGRKLPMDRNNKQHRTYNKGNKTKRKSSIRSYRDLIVYQKAKAVTLNSAQYYANKKFNWTEKYLIDQLIRKEIRKDDQNLLNNINEKNQEIIKMLTTMMRRLKN
jgi:hypothetical protein